MIAFTIGITNPFATETFKNLFCKAWQLSKNKFLELEVTYYAKDVIGFDFRWSMKCDHAGLDIQVKFATLTFHANVYDNRHWNHTTNNWKIYYPDGTTDDPADD